MTSASKRVALGAVLAATTIACELIVGIGDQPHLADASAVDAEGGSGTCALPTGGDAQIRIANVVPALAKYDFCLTPSGGQTPASGILASSGTACPPGLLYRNVLAPFSMPAGTYRVDAIAPGTSCSSASLASAPNVNLDTQTTTTVVLFGTDNGAQIQMKAFREETGSIADPKVRFMNAWSDGPSTLECGVTTSDELPATIIAAELFGQNTPFGSIATASGKVDANGYFSLIGGVTFPFGFAQTGTGATGVAVSRAMKTVGSVSTFAIGTTADERFPVDVMICNQDQIDGIFTRCSNQVPNDVIVNVYNAQLQGRFTPTEADRKAAVATAVAGMDSDFACITEVWDPKDKQAIIDAAKTHFPFVANFTTDFTSKPADPKDQQGNTPPAYTTPACPDVTSSQNLQSFLNCLAASCTTGAPNDLNGALPENATPCIVSNCIGAGATLIGTPSCYSCGVTQLESGIDFATTQTRCTTDPLARYAFDGNNGTLLLSTHPFLSGGSTDAGPGDAPSIVLFPSTEFRAGVIRASVDLGAGTGNSAKIDVYCTILTTPSNNAERPYAGQYGGGFTMSSDEWLAENNLQGKQLAAYVKATSGVRKRRAIIAGDLYSGPAIGGLQALNNQTTYDTVTPVLPLAMAVDYTPECTFCGTNPLVAGAGQSTAAIWSSFSLLSDLAVPETQSNAVIIKQLTATTDPSIFGLGDGGTLAIPPSFYYGMRTVVRVRP